MWLSTSLAGVSILMFVPLPLRYDFLESTSLENVHPVNPAIYPPYPHKYLVPSSPSPSWTITRAGLVPRFGSSLVISPCGMAAVDPSVLSQL